MASTRSPSHESRVTTMDDFPDKVLLHILSFLPTLDAIQTTTISPNFRDLWTSLPSLSFDFSLFLPPCDTHPETLRAFADFVNRALILRPHSDLRTFRLRLASTTEQHSYRRHIDSWIRYAVDRNVDLLSLTFCSKYLSRFDDAAETGAVYHFPFSELQNSTVRSLLLDGCNLDLPRRRSRMRFESLTMIVLEEILLTDEMISDLVSGCLNIEILTIRQCHGMKDMKISSVRLKRLELWHFKCDQGSVEICAPNLTNLTIIFFEVGKYVMDDSSALQEANVTCIYMAENYRYWSKIVRLLSHVKRFHVQNWWYKAMVAKDCLPRSFLFNDLNYLKLSTEYTKADLLGIAALLELSPRLGTMILDSDLRINEEIFGVSISEEFNRINFNLPSLRKLKLSCYWGAMDELHFLRLVLKTQVVLERIELHSVKLNNTSFVPIVLVKQGHGFQVVQGSFPSCSLHVYQGMDVYQGIEISASLWK